MKGKNPSCASQLAHKRGGEATGGGQRYEDLGQGA